MCPVAHTPRDRGDIRSARPNFMFLDASHEMAMQTILLPTGLAAEAVGVLPDFNMSTPQVNLQFYFPGQRL